MEFHSLALPVGFCLGQFQIERILGKGGFGITYVAIDTQLGKRVAIKELLPDSIATRVEGSTVVPQTTSMEDSWAWAKERFLEEARFLAGFSHPAIVGVHRLFEANGTAYMVMDYVEGESYEARLRRIGKEPDQASLMAVIGPILEGIEELHAQNLLHRDIKPDNILIDKRGKPVLIDFGSARTSMGATMTMTSMVTHGYSPIEQYQTKGRMGPWTDIYALGAVMCRAITGEKPPVAADRVIEDDFEWVSNRKPAGYDETFLSAVDWALRVRTEDRPQNISQFAVYLSPLQQSLQQTEQYSTQTAEPEPQSPTPVAETKNLAPAVIVAAMAALGVLGFVIFFSITAKSSPRELHHKFTAVLTGGAPANDKDKGMQLMKKSAENLSGMIEIPAGEVTINGRTEKVPAFKISKHEVTISEYAEFLKDLKDHPEKEATIAHPNQPTGKSHIPQGWADMTEINPPNPGYYARAKRYGRYQEAPLTLDSPVFGVDWFDAYAYAKWKGQRLPTEQEWELAGRGEKCYNHPWGNEFEEKLANTGSDFSPNPDPKVGAQTDGFKRWSPVNKPETDKTDAGVCGMAGNVSEWTATWAEDAERTGDKVPVYRGGNWKAANEKTILRRGTKLTEFHSDDALGFRTAQH